MTAIGKAIRTLLLSKSGVTSLIGARMWPGTLKQGTTLPAIRYQVFDGDSVRTLAGVADLGYRMIQIDCYAEVEPDADALGEAVRVELENYRGTVDGVVIERIRGDRIHSDVELSQVSSDEHRFVFSRDYMVWHTEPAINN